MGSRIFLVGLFCLIFAMIALIFPSILAWASEISGLFAAVMVAIESFKTKQQEMRPLYRFAAGLFVALFIALCWVASLRVGV